MPLDLWVNIALGNDLVTPGNKPLHEPMSTHIYDDIWRHNATMSYSCTSLYFKFQAMQFLMGEKLLLSNNGDESHRKLILSIWIMQ